MNLYRRSEACGVDKYNYWPVPRSSYGHIGCGNIAMVSNLTEPVVLGWTIDNNQSKVNIWILTDILMNENRTMMRREGRLLVYEKTFWKELFGKKSQKWQLEKTSWGNWKAFFRGENTQHKGPELRMYLDILTWIMFCRGIVCWQLYSCPSWAIALVRIRA